MWARDVRVMAFRLLPSVVVLVAAVCSAPGAEAKQLSWSLPVAEDNAPTPSPPPPERPPVLPAAQEPLPPPSAQELRPPPAPARPRSSSRKKKRQQRWLHLAEQGMELFQDGDMRGCVSRLQVRHAQRWVCSPSMRPAVLLSVAITRVAAGIHRGGRQGGQALCVQQPRRCAA